ncbi:MAG: hypothetical protein A3F72_09470 [Bacteroidetes bacterium RIFCSPLOWO2_12_FULL_35_15]|nr:MAG: hypothetical protein A3F72_09470 [Bacteroidetes bacterium RIFCSPLOWO2_12_FULL_35_15]
MAISSFIILSVNRTNIIKTSFIKHVYSHDLQVIVGQLIKHINMIYNIMFLKIKKRRMRIHHAFFLKGA